MLISPTYTKEGTFKAKNFTLDSKFSQRFAGGFDGVPIQTKYFVKTLSGILQNKVLQEKKSIFEDFKNLGKISESQRSLGPRSLKGSLSALTRYIKRIYSENFLQCNIALVDTMAEKAFCFNEQSTPEFNIGIKNRKQLKNFEKIVQGRLTSTSDAMSVFDTNEGEDFEQISYLLLISVIRLSLKQTLMIPI